eukprot:g2023.t1
MIRFPKFLRVHFTRFRVSSRRHSTANYTRLDEATPNDMKIVQSHFEACANSNLQVERALNLLKSQRGVFLGNKIDLYTHNLQTATRAYRAGESEELVVVALLHDIGELITPVSHGEIAASILRPYISEENYWILMHHEIFQFAYYSEAQGSGKAGEEARAIFESSPHYDACLNFCENYDQTSFDPDYETLPLEFFEPMVHRIISRSPFSMNDHNNEDITRAKKKLVDAYPTSE